MCVTACFCFMSLISSFASDNIWCVLTLNSLISPVNQVCFIWDSSPPGDFSFYFLQQSHIFPESVYSSEDISFLGGWKYLWEERWKPGPQRAAWELEIPKCYPLGTVTLGLAFPLSQTGMSPGDSPHTVETSLCWVVEEAMPGAGQMAWTLLTSYPSRFHLTDHSLPAWQRQPQLRTKLKGGKDKIVPWT